MRETLNATSNTKVFKVECVQARRNGAITTMSFGTVPLCVADVLSIRPITPADRKLLRDANVDYVIPNNARTRIETAQGSYFVIVGLDDILKMDPKTNPEAKLPETNQLIIAVQKDHPDIVFLPELPPQAARPEPFYDASQPAYRPRARRTGLSPQAKFNLQALSVVGLFSLAALGVVAYINKDNEFTRSTSCEVPTTSSVSNNALTGSRYNDGIKFAIDKQGRVTISEPDASGKEPDASGKPKQTHGNVSGNAVDGYTVDLPDSAGITERTVKVCLHRKTPWLDGPSGRK